MTDEQDRLDSKAYFAPLLPWQQTAWQQMTARVLAKPSTLPHALLVAGMSGMGKRDFVWRMVAWLLCQNRQDSLQGACGRCDSCQWLQAGTHPDLQVLPQAYAPTANDEDIKEQQGRRPSIKIDDVRAIQSFVHQGSRSLRLCVFDHAESMTIGAANALLKTLEEPQTGVHLLLITDAPAQLLPTIKSRVQQLPLQTLSMTEAREYVEKQLYELPDSEALDVSQLLRLGGGAPLAAVRLAKTPWYEKRQLWLTTWQALRTGKRSSWAASDYWQGQLSLTEFMQLSQLLLMDMMRVCQGLPALQTLRCWRQIMS